jgi:hypothetical protein
MLTQNGENVVVVAVGWRRLPGVHCYVVGAAAAANGRDDRDRC